MARYTHFTRYRTRYDDEYRSDIERARYFIESSGLNLYGRYTGWDYDEPHYSLKVTLADGSVFMSQGAGRTDAIEFVLWLMARARHFHNPKLNKSYYEDTEKLAREIFRSEYDRLVFPKRTFIERLGKR